jgi:uncharacterized membrane protein YgcG
MLTTIAEIITIVMVVLFAIANIAYYAPSSTSRLTFAKEKSAGHDSSSWGSGSGSDSASSGNDKSNNGDGSLVNNAASGSNDCTTNKVGDGAVVEVKPPEHKTSRFPGLDTLTNPVQIPTDALKDQSGGSGSSESSSGSSGGSSSRFQLW